MPVKLNRSGEVLTAYLSGEIDHHTARAMREEVDRAIELYLPNLLVLDFTDVGFMDSSGIGFVMGRYRNLGRIGATLHLSGAPPQIAKMMQLAGLEKLTPFPIASGGKERKK